jgi:hypothetical protein
VGKSTNPLPGPHLTWPRDDSLADGEVGEAPAEPTGRRGSTTCGRQFGEIRDGYLRFGAAPARPTAAASTSRQTRRHTFRAAFAVSWAPLRPVTPSRAIASTRLGQDCSPVSKAAET